MNKRLRIRLSSFHNEDVGVQKVPNMALTTLLPGKARYQRGHSAQFSGLKLDTNRFVLSILEWPLLSFLFWGNCSRIWTSSEFDLVILANIQALTRTWTKLIGDKRSHSPCCNFLYQPVPMCRNMFLSLYGISYSRFCRLKSEHYENHGISFKSPRKVQKTTKKHTL